jgi:hypothetical protein
MLSNLSPEHRAIATADLGCAVLAWFKPFGPDLAVRIYETYDPIDRNTCRNVQVWSRSEGWREIDESPVGVVAMSFAMESYVAAA